MYPIFHHTVCYSQSFTEQLTWCLGFHSTFTLHRGKILALSRINREQIRIVALVSFISQCVTGLCTIIELGAVTRYSKFVRFMLPTEETQSTLKIYKYMLIYINILINETCSISLVCNLNAYLVYTNLF